MDRLLAFAAALALMSFQASADAPDDGERLAMASDPDFETLLKRPEKIAYRYEKIPKAEGDGVLVVCDVHSACLARAETLFGVFTDFSQAKRLNPSVLEIRYDLSAWPPVFISDQVIGFSLLGIKVKYQFSLECRYIQEGPGQYRGDWKMIESKDRTFTSIEGSFIISEIQKDGRMLSYLRWRQETRIRKAIFGMKPFLDALTPKEAVGLAGRYSREAERREAALGTEKAGEPSHP